MSDISIGKFKPDNICGTPSQGGTFNELKREYLMFLKKAEKSDMKNSIMFKQKQLEILEALKIAAEKESKAADYHRIVEEIWCINAEISQQRIKDSEQNSISCMPPLELSKPKNSYASLVRVCKNSKGEIDESTSKLVSLFKYSDVRPVDFARFVDRCRGIDEKIPKETFDAISTMIDADVSPEFILDIVDDMPVTEESSLGKLDFSWVHDFIQNKMLGLSEFESLKYAQNIPQEYDNKKDVYSSCKKLSDAGFDVEMGSKLISLFSSPNPKTDKLSFASDSVKYILLMNKNLEKTRNNEKKDSENPISQLNESVFSNDRMVITLKDNKVVGVATIDDSKTVSDAKKEYSEYASGVERQIVFDFAKKYTLKNGKLDLNALRVFNTVRSMGVSYEELLPLTEACLSPVEQVKNTKSAYSINVDKLATITTLKKFGALSSDLSSIIDAIKLDENGKYSLADVQNACELTSSVIAGKDVVSLLPVVRNSEELKDMALELSSILENKEFILPLLNLSTDSSGNYDENAAEIIFSLAENLLDSENTKIKDKNFVSIATKIIEKSLTYKKDKVDVNCANVCVAMCRQKESVPNILKALEISKDEYGYTNESLADIVWDMCRQNAKFEDIVDLINVCKPINGILDLQRAELIADILDKGASVDEVKKFARKLDS